uniref:EF-hand domain-containing protein n=1 Tax=Cryptomonas curvata TaxID=233186 RepID=A0A7S0M473_9CRYP|mmetsp:Transcript_2404/g.5026  ORF Transcript_2404/g.5026 Transcript_2404/m.5026 type:complete len:253 (+) Transcript_2404:3-761(+)
MRKSNFLVMTHAAKWRITLAFAVACLFLNAVCAHTPAHDADHAGQENMSPEELEAELKKVQEEVEKLRHEHNEVFTAGDTDKDGFMSPTEFIAVQKKDDPSLEAKDLEEAFSDHDKDGSGSLSLSEWQQPFEETVQSMLNEGEPDESEEDRIAHHRQEFNSYDTNADGFLDQGELDNLAKQVSAGHAEQGEAAHGNVSGAEVMQALDIDADGKVTFEEYVLDGATEGDDVDPDDVGAHDLSLDDITGDGDLS